MALNAGTRVGPYEIVALIGAGGMGEVYRAKDTKLNRDVGLKVLPELLASDQDRLARFRREAQVLASLNHPNIAHLYGFEEGVATAAGPGGALHALVMELVEGPTLADLLGQGSAIKTDDALRIARQIADALEAAHEQGIVHRDLKPANVKVRDDGTVKVLDFGLAKALEPSGAASAEAMNSPTLTARATQLGVILGTAAYMAPEQAKGKVVDRRADIWAFGVVLYEMLTGRRAFDAEDISDTLAAVLTREIDWTALPADVPPRLRALLRDCLIRDPRQRLRDIGDARIALDRLISGTLETSPTPSAAGVAPTRRIWWWSAGLFAAAAFASAATWALVHQAPGPPAQPVRFAVILPAAQRLLGYATDRALAISPDGTHIAYVATGGTLVVRAIDQVETETLPGITGARSPFFSPDGKWLGFFQRETEIRRVSITGGPSIPVCKILGVPFGASWGPNDTIFFSTANSGLFAVSASGGDPKMITKQDFAHGEFGHRYPSVLPSGEAVLFTISGLPGQQSGTDQIAVLDLKTGKKKTLLRGGRQAEYVDPGYLVYSAAGALRAVRFDLDHLEVQGDAVPVLAQVATYPLGTTEFSISRSGSLVYLPGTVAASAARSLVWIDRKGREESINAPPRAYYALRLSPDGTRLAIDIRDQENDIWVWDLALGTSTRITSDPGPDSFPIWATDGRHIAYSSMRGGAFPNLFWQAADRTGPPEQLTTADHVQFAMSLSPDGGSLLVKEQNAGTGDDISILPMTGKRDVASLIRTSFNERNAEVSPDGHWLAYESDESTVTQIYVQPFPQANNGGRVQVSPNGGSKPAWGPSSRELFYFNDNALYAVAVHTTPSFSPGKPVKLFDARLTWQLVSGRFYDVSRDGQRFVIIKDPRPASQASAETPGLMVVVNWVEELKAKVVGK